MIAAAACLLDNFYKLIHIACYFFLSVACLPVCQSAYLSACLHASLSYHSSSTSLYFCLFSSPASLSFFYVMSYVTAKFVSAVATMTIMR